jgi:hypothetical protein
MTWATHWNGSRMLNGKMRDVPIDPHMLEPVEVMVLKEFGIGDTLMKAGTTITVPRHSDEYLRFLQLVVYAPVL